MNDSENNNLNNYSDGQNKNPQAQQPAQPVQQPVQPVQQPVRPVQPAPPVVPPAGVNSPVPNYTNNNPNQYPYGRNPAPNMGYPYTPMYPSAPSGQPGFSSYATPEHSKPARPERPEPPKPKKSKAGLIILIAVVCFLVAFAIGFSISAMRKYVRNNPGQSEVQAEVETKDNVSVPLADGTVKQDESEGKKDGKLSATEIYEKVSDSSVGVLVYMSNGRVNSFSDDLYGEGSGVISEENSSHTGTYIITCAHVVSGTGLTVKVQLNNGDQYDAAVVGIDNKTDIAVLFIKKTGLKAAEFASTDSLKVGQTVYAIGNPGGVEFFGSFTSGIVSAIARPVNSPVGYEMESIQHDAAINPGNSGGALVNENGQVIGINSSKIAAEEYEGMGFAVPSETVKTIADDIISHGYVTDRAKLGISYAVVSQSQAHSMIVQMNDYPAGSVIIASIQKGSSFEGTKAQVGDLIIRANGKDLTTPDVLLDMVQNGHIGDKLKLTLVHIDSNYKTTEYELEVTLVADKGEIPEEADSNSEYENPFGFNN